MLKARAGELESEFPWGIVHQLFGSVVAPAQTDAGPRLLDGAAALARPALGIEATHNQVDVSYATLHGLYWLTVSVADERPVVLSIDDMHWADPPSLRYLLHLLPRIAELPVLVLMATRPAASAPTPGADLLARIAAQPAVRGLHPAALSQSASTRLVRERLASDASEDVCVACHELSETAGSRSFIRSSVRPSTETLRGRSAASGTTAPRTCLPRAMPASLASLRISSSRPRAATGGRSSSFAAGRQMHGRGERPTLRPTTCGERWPSRRRTTFAARCSTSWDRSTGAGSRSGRTGPARSARVPRRAVSPGEYRIALGDALTLLGQLVDAIRVLGAGIAELDGDVSVGLALVARRGAPGCCSLGALCTTAAS